MLFSYFFVYFNKYLSKNTRIHTKKINDRAKNKNIYRKIKHQTKINKELTLQI